MPAPPKVNLSRATHIRGVAVKTSACVESLAGCYDSFEASASSSVGRIRLPASSHNFSQNARACQTRTRMCPCGIPATRPAPPGRRPLNPETISKKQLARPHQAKSTPARIIELALRLRSIRQPCQHICIAKRKRSPRCVWQLGST